MDAIDIHDFEKQVRLQKQLLDRDKISESDKKIIKAFIREKTAKKSTALATVRKALSNLRSLSKIKDSALKKKIPFADMTKDNMVDLINEIENKKNSKGRLYKAETKKELKVHLKMLFKFIRKTEFGYPEEVAWFSTQMSEKDKKSNDMDKKYFSQKEMDAILKQPIYPRDQCLLWLLADTGTRIGEILSRTIGDVSTDDDGYWHISVEGKTGQRKVMLLDSAPYLRAWLNIHPERDKDSAPLFVKHGTIQPLQYANALKLLKGFCEQAGINGKFKKFYNFRHTWTTEASSELTDQEIKIHQGLSSSSRVLDNYVHLKMDKVNEKKKRNRGIIEAEKEKKKILKCPECNEQIRKDAVICDSCKRPLRKRLLVSKNTEIEELRKEMAETKRDREETRELIKEMRNIIKEKNEVKKRIDMIKKTTGF